MRLLLIEDDAELSAMIARALTRAGHVVACAADGESGLASAVTAAPDVLILDRMLPRLDGIALLKQVRRAGMDTPVLMLTARDAIQDRVDGLEAGADDYLVKPFAQAELSARVTALGRRPRSPDRNGIAVAGTIRLDRIGRRVTRAGRPVPLQPREFQLLDELVRHGGHVVTRAMLLKAVWNFDFDPRTKVIESHMSRLRAKIDAGFAEPAIETVRGEGYRLRGDA